MNIRLLPRGVGVYEPDYLDPNGVRLVNYTAGLVDVDVYPELRKFTIDHRRCGVCYRLNGRHGKHCAYRRERRNP